MNVKQLVFRLEHEMNEFYKIGLFDLAESYFQSIKIILQAITEEEWAERKQ